MVTIYELTATSTVFALKGVPCYRDVGVVMH